MNLDIYMLLEFIKVCAFNIMMFHSNLPPRSDFYTRFFLANHSSSAIAYVHQATLIYLYLTFRYSQLDRKLSACNALSSGYNHWKALRLGILPHNGDFGIILICVFVRVISFSSLQFINCDTCSLFMLSLAKPFHYYQVFLSQGVGMGIGVGLTFTPTMSNIAHKFYERKALATGIVLSGSSAGALIFPISKKIPLVAHVAEHWQVLPSVEVGLDWDPCIALFWLSFSNLIPRIGFGKAVRASAYIVLGFVVIGNCLIRRSARLIGENASPPNIKGFFVDPPYVVTVFVSVITSTAKIFRSSRYHLQSSYCFNRAILSAYVNLRL